MEVTTWLMAGDPSIRWQTMRDLLDAPPEEVAAERRRVAEVGWGARLLALRDPDGQWAGGACFPGPGRGRDRPGQPWISTLPVLALLRLLGLDPDSAAARQSVDLLARHCRWEHAGEPFFDGEVEPCINGRVVALGAYLGRDVAPLVTRLLGEQLGDGGWNCETEHGSVRSSFHTTINVLEGLLAWEQETGSTVSVDARRRGEDYLLDRRLCRRLSTGEIVDPTWLDLSFPPQWRYDVLRGLDHFRGTGDGPDPRLAEAVEHVRSKQRADGRWLLENTHAGEQPFSLEDGDGRPSRWNTLRALRVLRWYDAG